MRVKVGDIWYDAHDVPIKVELTEREREQVQQISAPGENGRYGYAIVPMGVLDWNNQQAHEWMRDERFAYPSNANRHIGKEEVGGIEVFVTGDRPEIGKTLVAANIARALLQAGFSKVKYSCMDGDLMKFLPGLQQVTGTAMADLLKTVPNVIIHDNNQRPDDMPRPLHLKGVGDPNATPLDPNEPVEITVEFTDPNPPKAE